MTAKEYRHRYISVLRCSTWHVWPEHVHITSNAITLPVNLAKGVSLVGSLHLFSYTKRSRSKIYPIRAPREKNGPILWRGQYKTGHIVGESIVQATQDSMRYKIHYEHAYKGEVDIQFHLATQEDIPIEELKESALSVSFAAMAFINLELSDLLIPVAPLQIMEIVGHQKLENRTRLQILAWPRSHLGKANLQDTADRYAHVFSSKVSGLQRAKLRVALGLYASHFFERSSSSRFLTLVMALEALASPLQRSQTVINLLEQWKRQVDDLKSELQPDSEEAQNLEALSRELFFRREDSIRNQIRRLVLEAAHTLGGVDALEFSRRAVRVYDQRSTLVHEGTLSSNDLSQAEKNAKEILELVLKVNCQPIVSSRDKVA
jgi:hypothetical protein